MYSERKHTPRNYNINFKYANFLAKKMYKLICCCIFTERFRSENTEMINIEYSKLYLQNPFELSIDVPFNDLEILFQKNAEKFAKFKIILYICNQKD